MEEHVFSFLPGHLPSPLRVGPPPMLQDFLTAGVGWVGQYHYGYDGQVFFTRLHVTYDRQHFPQDLIFEETPNKESYQARYVITHPAVSDFQCNEAQTYLQGVYKRRYNELQQLAMLTGWDVSNYAQYVNILHGYQPEIIAEPKIDPTPIHDSKPQPDVIDTTGMITPQSPDDSNKIQQASFNAPFMNDDSSGGSNNGMNQALVFLFMGSLVAVSLASRKKKEAVKT